MGSRDLGRPPGGTGKRERAWKRFLARISLGIRTARTHARTTRNDFPVGLTPQPPMDPTQKYSKGMDTKAKTPKTPKKPIYNGTGSWDLGVGTWDLGPRTWDMGAGDGTWDFGSRHGRSTVLSTAPCPGAGRMICLFLFMVPKPKYR